jgi:PTS system ascorbate-specific IIA component
LQTVAQHVYPDCAAQMRALDVTPGMSVEQIESDARAKLDELNVSEALIFTDVFGATPCNAALRLADGVKVKVVSGVSVPMVWRALSYADEPLDMLVTRALAGAAQGAMQVAVSRPQFQAQPLVRDDQDDAANQQ